MKKQQSQNLGSAPRIIPRSEHRISRKDISSTALKVLYRLKRSGHLAYLAGGGVRDLLLHREPKDFDIVTDAHPNQVRKIFRNCRLIGRRFRLAHVYFGSEIVEVATFRANATQAHNAAGEAQPRRSPTRQHQSPLKRKDGLILRDNVYGTPEDDALRRDFTVNALFYNIDGFTIIDYVNGLADLDKRLIRSIGDPAVRYVEDPVRMIRAIRFAASLGFDIEEKTRQSILDHRNSIANASNARLYEEVLKLFLCGSAERTFSLSSEMGMAAALFPRFTAWLDHGNVAARRQRAAAALEEVDRRTKKGHPPSPCLLFSLLFGEYLEVKAATLSHRGLRPAEAMRVAVLNHFAELAKQVLVPKRVSEAVSRVLGSQHRFRKTRGKQPHFFVRRSYFADAFDYMRFASRMTGTNAELVAWWESRGSGRARSGAKQ
jgi:poly(A) polymerase